MPTKLKIAGFTLLEVMLAMTLLSIMVVLLFSSLKIGAESWDKGEKKINEVNEKAVVYQFFKHHLPSIMPLSDVLLDNESPFSFSGTPNGFQFVSIFPASANRKGLQLFKVNFDDSDEHVIKVELTPFYANALNEPWEPEEVILLENVEDFELSYFNIEESVWEENWLEKSRLPHLVKIKITLLDQSYWPEMIFSLKLATGENMNSEEEI